VFPIVAVILGIVYLYVMVRWVMYFFNKVDPVLRERIGKRFGVTINKNFRQSWEVAEPNQGARGCLIEMLQPVFLIPAMFLPVIILTVIVLLLAQLGIIQR
jgi:hypothetical protein